MITCSQIRNSINPGKMKTVPFGLGNTLFMIASTIGIAKMNGYSFGFDNFLAQKYFVNSLPKTKNKKYYQFAMNRNYKGADIGFQGFNVPDNSDIHGYIGSWKYFDHCRELIKYYFTLKNICEPIRDSIMISFRDYDRENASSVFRRLDYNYFQKALAILPDKPVYVVSDNPIKAKEVIREDFVYVHNSPIVDFYLLTRANYIIISPSSFGWWCAYLSEAECVAPLPWFVGEWADCPVNINDDLILPQWKTL